MTTVDTTTREGDFYEQLIAEIEIDNVNRAVELIMGLRNLRARLGTLSHLASDPASIRALVSALARDIARDLALASASDLANAPDLNIADARNPASASLLANALINARDLNIANARLLAHASDLANARDLGIARLILINRAILGVLNRIIGDIDIQIADE